MHYRESGRRIEIITLTPILAALQQNEFKQIIKKPEECLDMQEIRTQIDSIDKNIIELLGNRFQYVKAASKFKTDENSVKAPERLAAMLVQRRKWAEENCLSPDIIEKMFRDLVGYFIDQEMKHWENK